VANILDLFSVMAIPALLNNLSHGTEVAVTHSRFLTIINRRGYNALCTVHHFKGSSNLFIRGSCKYLSNSIIPAAVGLIGV